VFGLEDVEMRDSPIRFEPMLTPSASGSSSLGRTEVKPDEGPVLGAEVKPKVAETKSEEAKASVAGDEVDGSGRPIAQGGYNREMKRRQRKKNNGRKARVDSDDEVSSAFSRLRQTSEVQWLILGRRAETVKEGVAALRSFLTQTL